MGRPRKLVYKPKKKADCAYCGQPIYKGTTRYRGKRYHTLCLIQAVKEGKV